MKKVLLSIAFVIAVCATSSVMAQDAKKEGCSKKTECVKPCDKAEDKKCDKAEAKKCCKAESKKCCKSKEVKCTKSTKKCCKEKQSAEKE